MLPMTLRDTIALIEAVAASQPDVNMIVRNDIYKLNSCPAARYGAFAWTQEQHREGIDDYGPAFTFALFYVDRLTEDGGNQVEVQSTAISTLRNVIRALAATLEIEDWTYNTFNQRFADLCAGAFARVTIRVPADTICPEDYDTDNQEILTI